MDNPETDIFSALTIILMMANAFFLFAEIAITNVHNNKLEDLADDGNKRAVEALKIMDNPNTYVSAVQIGTVCCNILIGLFTGIAIAPVLAKELIALGVAEHAEFTALIIGAVVIILLCLILSTILPRRIAINNPENSLLKILAILKFWQKILLPFIKCFAAIANAILLPFGIGPKKVEKVTEDEVKDLIERGTETGTFEKAEQDLVDRIFHMSDQTAYSLMTPRTQVLWLDLEDSDKINLNLIKNNKAGVFLVGRENLDEFVGIIYTKELLNAYIDNKEIKLEDFVRKPMFVPRAMESFRLMEKFRESDNNEAIVLDEYGGVVGFITIFDIINELLGDITGKQVDKEASIIQRDENSWYVDGLYDVDDFKEKFDIDKLPNEDNGHFQTMGGFLTSYFGYIPKIGESKIWQNYRFEVISMDRARIDRILVSIIK